MDEVEFLISQIRKFIAVGAHVKVMDGRYANETGVVVAVENMDGEEGSDFDCTAVVLTDMTHKEISGNYQVHRVCSWRITSNANHYVYLCSENFSATRVCRDSLWSRQTGWI
jgi:hypothetical protein